MADDTPTPEPTPERHGHTADWGGFALNVMQFCRTLRAAGLPVGPGKTLQALEAVRTVGIQSREDFYWTLHAALVNRRDQREIFDQAFHVFWRNPDILKRVMSLMLPTIDTGKSEEDQRQLSRRLSDALMQDKRPGEGESPDDDAEPEIELDASLTMSDRELLQAMDFEQMTAEEIERAKQEIRRMTLPLDRLPTRRWEAVATGPRVDMRRTLRRSLRGGGATIDLVRRRRATRPPPLVLLCDISGSMSQYSRMLLHFMHAVTTDRDRVHGFVFGTRLTNVTRWLRHKDPDEALAKVGEQVGDWSGGTRISACLTEFNQIWSRRVLGQGAVVVLITDGLERDDPDHLGFEMDRLHRSCRKLIWLNPLLRWDGYAPKSQGARAMMPHCDDFRPVHNLASLANLVDALAAEARPARGAMGAWRRLATEEAA
ncbi:MAG: VWA domain-containing protein [Alphaproteobacteria bacterium]|jgi:uncharacterized protein with von Willebrand factor type A (vWA) domain|nr:VWA domain-containing protein [Alphaproteobacteria bacterium]